MNKQVFLMGVFVALYSSSVFAIDNIVHCKLVAQAKCGIYRYVVNCGGIEGYVAETEVTVADGIVKIDLSKTNIHSTCGEKFVPDKIIPTCNWVSAVDLSLPAFEIDPTNVIAMNIEIKKTTCALEGDRNYSKYQGPKEFYAGVVQCLAGNRQVVACVAEQVPDADECLKKNIGKTYEGNWKK